MGSNDRGETLPYVNQPNWDNILRHGLACMEIALSDPKFVKLNLPEVDPYNTQSGIALLRQVIEYVILLMRLYEPTVY